ncbi:MAG: hypothetical protein ACFFCM_09545, partial [Promethearchaeota archaeon]
MKTDNLSEKTILIQELLNSGINVTPSILDFLLNLDEPLKKIKLIIKNVSFLPNFNSHLTVDVLQKISDEELLKELQKVLLKEINSKAIQEKKDKMVENVKATSSPNIIPPIKSKLKTFKNSLESTQHENKLENQEDSLLLSNNKLKNPISSIRSNSNVSNFEGSKSTIKFKPIAKDYDPEFKILKDPTG